MFSRSVWRCWIRFCIILFYVGMLWLANTTSVEDIIFNAATMSEKRLCLTLLLFSHLHPSPRFRCCQDMQNGGCPALAVSAVAALFGMLKCQMIVNISMKELSKILCGGDIDFVFMAMPSTSWIVTVPTSSGDGTFAHAAIHETVWNEHSLRPNSTEFSGRVCRYVSLDTCRFRQLRPLTGRPIRSECQH